MIYRLYMQYISAMHTGGVLIDRSSNVLLVTKSVGYMVNGSCRKEGIQGAW
jgi:hypothetical protein